MIDLIGTARENSYHDMCVKRRNVQYWQECMRERSSFILCTLLDSPLVDTCTSDTGRKKSTGCSRGPFATDAAR